ncbi:MAG: hypothetical protein K0S56_953 [Microvirga sp.]|jgi:hypothetical protein|nr:hypothetical protein [Microvirga sp.]
MSARIKPLTLALAAALVLSFAGAAAEAQAPSKMKVCADQWNELKAKNQTGGQTYRDFSKKCMSGDGAAAPPAANPAATAAPTTAAPTTTAKPAGAPKPTQAAAKEDEEGGTGKEDLAKCNASWKDYKAQNNVSGAKAWHVFMARCLP